MRLRCQETFFSCVPLVFLLGFSSWFFFLVFLLGKTSRAGRKNIKGWKKKTSRAGRKNIKGWKKKHQGLEEKTSRAGRKNIGGTRQVNKTCVIGAVKKKHGKGCDTKKHQGLEEKNIKLLVKKNIKGWKKNNKVLGKKTTRAGKVFNKGWKKPTTKCAGKKTTRAFLEKKNVQLCCLL